jgi:hypothetical protein
MNVHDSGVVVVGDNESSYVDRLLLCVCNFICVMEMCKQVLGGDS